MLTCHNLTCKRGGYTIFQNLGFTLGASGLLILRGHNGAGKTTLLKAIAGLAKPDAGDITWHERNIYKDGDSYYANLHYIGHKNALKSQLTVEDNIRFWAQLNESEELVSAALAYFDLESRANVPVAMLSAGWQRRVALARLVATDTEIWLLDEPFTNLDEDTKMMLAGLITTRCDQGGVVILSSHGNTPFESAITLNVGEFN